MYKEKNYGWRLKFTKFIFLSFFLVLTIRLYFLQIDAHSRFTALAEKQHWIGKEIPAERGEILTSDEYPLALNIPAYQIFAVPQEIDNPEETASKLITIIGYESQVTNTDMENYLLELENDDETKNPKELEKETIIADMRERLSQKELLYVPIADKQDETIKNQIESENLKGIYFEQDYKRYYPEGKMASHVLGFVGKNDQGEDQGYYGIEGYFNGELKGISGRVALEKDAVGRPIPVGEYLPVGSDDGRNIVLTISRELQYLLEKKLREGVEKYDAANASVILMEPQSGKILAMASYPNYNPGNWKDWGKDYSEKDEDDLSDEEKLMKKYGVSVFPNLSVSDVYEPGSIFKPMTISMGLNSGKINENTIVESAPYSVGVYTIRTWNDKYFGLSTPAVILQHSDNTGMARISQFIGIDVFYDYLTAFGFREKTGITLEDEDLAWINPKESWGEVELATAAFGQGIAVTPIQMMQAYTAIINDGVMMEPYIVSEIQSPEGNITYSPQEKAAVISETTAKKIVDMLVSVVEKGEFQFAVLKGYKMAGKTGTAQIAKDGRYDSQQTNCTFIGFAPASNPKFLMLVKITRPTASTYSAETAVPLWMDMAKDLFPYFSVSPLNE